MCNNRMPTQYAYGQRGTNLRLYNDGFLRKEASRLTKTLGNGRLRRDDDTFADIGSFTGGYV